MGLARRFAEQLARPEGFAGKLLGNAMDVANRRPTRLALDLLGARDGERVLDAGCGTGATLDVLLDRAMVDAWGIDPSPTMIAQARARLGDRARLEKCLIEDMWFGDDTFDAVLALNVLYFARPDGSTLRQIHRVLRPGGRLVAYVTHRESMENWPFARQGVHRLFDTNELVDELIAGGFARAGISVQEHAITGSVDGLLACATKES
ncbi:MAG: class I SAM-dependent methyltransferase [Novosphingobium sp.]|nr:class I SAM-dependent methyltransferase [Novosphingobium sp.]